MVPGMGEAAGAAVGALTSIAGGIIGGGKRRREQQAAQKEHDIAKAKFQNLDTSNLAANQQNVFEDLTVNTQAADFAAQQQQQAISNTMGKMQGAAGGSGIAALAQAMAGQQSQNLQQASSSIAQQEGANQMAAARGAQQVQAAKLAGAGASREAESSKVSSILSTAQDRKSAADQARADAQESIMSGIGEMGAAAGSMMSDRRLKHDIKFLRYSPSGLKIYTFKYNNVKFGNGMFEGVMSDEIPEHAVIQHQDGYDRVDYSKIDVEFKQI